MKRLLLVALVFIACTSLTQMTDADPCGMVPPFYLGRRIPIKRIGEQRTYVFFRKGMESIVIRPGFQGKTSEFGMLIPFPSIPSIRKVPEEIFYHIAAAIDPPEIVMDLNPQWGGGGGGGFGGGFGGGGAHGGLGITLKKNQVKVIREEAIGMYETAVLAAGSSQALAKWMTDHKYRFPKGMDKVCDEYIELGWCFVAVKARVGLKKNIDPKPAMRQAKANMPKGSIFDGHVQAMGFRFYAKKLVVPMRLSAFNEGKLRNIVYLLTTHPMKINKISERFVVRQVSGFVLWKNMTHPRPVRLIGVSLVKNGWAKTKLGFVKIPRVSNRSPQPFSKYAKALFAADMKASYEKRMILPRENTEKMLSTINEHLGLRGAEIDRMVDDSNIDDIDTKNVNFVKKMWMTVIDGDFPKEIIAKENLTFSRYKMPSFRNRRQNYDANEMKKPVEQKGFVLASLDDAPMENGENVGENSRGTENRWGLFWLMSLVLVGATIGFVWFRKSE